MSKRNLSEILESTLPQKSRKKYLMNWKQFLLFKFEREDISDEQLMLKADDKPSEEDYLQYFDVLHSKLKSTTIWSIYSMLNSVHQLLFAEKMQVVYPRLTNLLKSYNNTHERKVANVFDRQEITNFLNLEDTSPFIILRKAAVVISICGGLRTCELTDLNFANIAQVGDTYVVNLKRKKQHGEKDSSTFVVPKEMAMHITNYKMALSCSIGENNVTGRFLKGTPIYSNSKKSRFINQPMGINMAYKIGKDVAKKLGLPDADNYTGHCFRRTSATMAADAGATPVQMQRAYGWKSINTAQKYVTHSKSGADSIASLFSKTITSASTSTSNIEECSSSSGQAKIYHIHGENNTFNFY